MDDIDVMLSPLQKKFLAELGITNLYDNQKLALEPIKNGSNMVVSMPTASGKSLIAYLSIVDALSKNMHVCYVVPLRALASEKFRDLSVLERIGYKVGLAIGSVEEKVKLKDIDLMIATSEKLDSIMRIGNEWFESLGLIVVDEIHMLGESNRGATLEALITKIKTMNPEIQIIGLSATIPNGNEIASWLNAMYIYSEWRPVELKVYALDQDSERLYSTSTDFEELSLKKDSTPIIQIMDKIIEDHGQVLLFSNSRKNVEKLAEIYSPYIESHLSDDEMKKLNEAKSQLDDDVEETSIGKRLYSLISKGVSFHHAGLHYRQRELIEKLFRERILKMIVATPTLAAGINMPAKLVVINETRRFENGASVPLSTFEIKQMCGRAGRPGYDTKGEAIILAKRANLKYIFDKYINGTEENIISHFTSDKNLRTQILSVISTMNTTDQKFIENFVENSFASFQNPHADTESLVDRLLKYLEDNGFVTTDGYNVSITSFGKLTSYLYLDTETAIKFRSALGSDEFEHIRKIDILQLLSYNSETIPLFVGNMDEKKYWMQIAKEFEHEWHTGYEDLIYNEQFLGSIKTAYMLEDWTDEVPIYEIEDKYNIGPGDIANKIETAKWLSYSLVELSKLLKPSVKKNLDILHTSISYGVRNELTELVMLHGIGRIRSRKLYDAGIHSLDDLLKADIGKVSRIIPRKVAIKIRELYRETRT